MGVGEQLSAKLLPREPTGEHTLPGQEGSDAGFASCEGGRR